MHVLETSIELPRPIRDVFAFFSDAENFERTTPPELAFEIITETPLEVSEGTLIDYRLPIYPIGGVVLPLVRRQLEHIFQDRAKTIEQILQ